MRPSIFIFTGSLLTLASGAVLPSHDSRRQLFRRVAGSLSAGIDVPSDLSNGVYMAKFEDGHWVHEFVANGTDSMIPAGPEAKRDIPVGNLRKRDNWIQSDCGHYELQHRDTDEANDALDRQCNPGLVRAGYNFYSIWGDTVAGPNIYACNFAKLGQDLVCTGEMRRKASAYITGCCGWYMAGWTSEGFQRGVRWIPGLSYGYEYRYTRFCGKGA